MKRDEINILLYFLKGSYSTRELDSKLGFLSKKTKGWKSWEILKKYNISTHDKGKLFIYNQTQAKKIIRDIPKVNKPGAIDILITTNRPSNIEKYRNSFLLAESEEKLNKILSGETRNIIRHIFLPQKKLAGLCQYKNCNKTNLETAHYKKGRIELFIASASKFKTDLNDLYMFDLYKIFEDFLYVHSEKKSVCFLCRNHHREFDKKKRSNISAYRLFKRNIEW